MVNDKEKLWAMLAHVSYFVFAVFGPLIILLAHKDIIKMESRFVAHHAKQALYYHIGTLVITIVVSVITCGFGAVIIFVFMVFPIIAGIKSHNGEWYTYPLMEKVTA